MTLEAETAAVRRDATTVVVCAFSLERFELTRACAQSLLAQVPTAPEVVIVVDHNPELEQQLRGETPPVPELDTHLLDVAAHWMEIRSGREDVLHK